MSHTPTAHTTPTAAKPLKPLRGVRVLSLALNLPGPAALMRLHQMGARCTKLEGPAGDPMGHYKPQAYSEMHAGIKLVKADLKTEAGQKKLHALLAQTDPQVVQGLRKAMVEVFERRAEMFRTV